MKRPRLIHKETSVNLWKLAVALHNRSAFHALYPAAFLLDIPGRQLVATVWTAIVADEPSQAAGKVIQVSTRQPCNRQATNEPLTADATLGVVVLKCRSVKG